MHIGVVEVQLQTFVISALVGGALLAFICTLLPGKHLLPPPLLRHQSTLWIGGGVNMIVWMLYIK